MFTFECLNHRAKLILASWEASGFDLRDFYVREEDGYTHIHCKYDYIHYKSEEADILLRQILVLLNLKEPYVFESHNGHSSWYLYRPDGSFWKMSGEVSPSYNWPQQIERYRVALLLTATG